jgi:hypothetical protein
MKVVIYFDREQERVSSSLRYVMYGKYSSSGFLFVGDTDVEAFGTSLNTGYRTHVFRQKASAGRDHYDSVTDYLLLSVDEEETHKLLLSCQACVQSKKAFNLHDLLLIHVPFREPREIPLFEATALHNTQAVILILRECLHPGNRLRHAIEGLHSRTTYTETMYDRLRPYTLPVLWANLFDLVRWPEVQAVEASKAVHESLPPSHGTHKSTWEAWPA